MSDQFLLLITFVTVMVLPVFFCVSDTVFTLRFFSVPAQVKLEMYRVYFRTIGVALIVPIVFLYAFQQAASLAYNFWLSLWADDPVVNGTQMDTDLKLGVFGALGLAQGGLLRDC